MIRDTMGVKIQTELLPRYAALFRFTVAEGSRLGEFDSSPGQAGELPVSRPSQNLKRNHSRAHYLLTYG